MSPVPDGRVVHLADRLVFTSTESFDAPIEDVGPRSPSRPARPVARHMAR